MEGCRHKGASIFFAAAIIENYIYGDVRYESYLKGGWPKIMQRKGKGNGILGLAIAVIMATSVFAPLLIVCAGAYSIGSEYNIIKKNNAASIQHVLVGQNLDFFTNWGTSDTVTIHRVKAHSVEWWKPADRLRNLIKAGALIAAEIDRIQES